MIYWETKMNITIITYLHFKSSHFTTKQSFFALMLGYHISMSIPLGVIVKDVSYTELLPRPPTFWSIPRQIMWSAVIPHHQTNSEQRNVRVLCGPRKKNLSGHEGRGKRDLLAPFWKFAGGTSFSKFKATLVKSTRLTYSMCSNILQC